MLSNGPDLPIPLAGHCQLHVGDSNVFIYGGFSHLNNHSLPIVHNNAAWNWKRSNDNWTRIPTASPCPPSRFFIHVMQQCAWKQPFEVVILHQDYVEATSCASLLNVETFEWIRIVETSTLLPLGGFLLTGSNMQKMFYIGGHGSYPFKESGRKTIYKLNQHWELTKMELPFGISAWDTKLIESRVNVSQCTQDEAKWPQV